MRQSLFSTNCTNLPQNTTPAQPLTHM
jgi:hypothetical protein